MRSPQWIPSPNEAVKSFIFSPIAPYSVMILRSGRHELHRLPAAEEHIRQELISVITPELQLTEIGLQHS